MLNNAQRFRTRLAQATRLGDSVIEAAWPEWWSDAADASPSALAELRFSIARKLGLDPRSLLDDEQPRFTWDDSAKYKNFKGDTGCERPAITSFGTSVSRMLIRAVPSYHPAEGIEATTLRKSILGQHMFVGLEGLLAFLWGVGVPVIHLRVFPFSAKRMCAMAVRAGERYAVLLARDSQYPAWTAFHLAHEVGHIVLGHIRSNSALVDMEDLSEAAMAQDDEEIAADRYALHLLTGNPDLKVVTKGQGHNPMELAGQVLKLGSELAIEPGALALCYAHSTKDWSTAQAALPHIYERSIHTWEVINGIAIKQIMWNEMSDENECFIRAVMGGK